MSLGLLRVSLLDLHLTVIYRALSLLKLCDGDLPGVHPTERGQGWGEIQLEPVALQPPGGHQARGARLLPLHTAKGEARFTAGPVRAGAVQPGQLQGRAQPPMVSEMENIATDGNFFNVCFCCQA